MGSRGSNGLAYNFQYESLLTRLDSIVQHTRLAKTLFKSRDATVAVIDGPRVCLTNLKRGNVPPPMYAHSVDIPGESVSAIHVAFHGLQDGRFAVLSSDRRIIFYRGMTEFEQEIEVGLNARQVFWIEEDVV
jgi:hypothetical protein